MTLVNSDLNVVNNELKALTSQIKLLQRRKVELEKRKHELEKMELNTQNEDDDSLEEWQSDSFPWSASLNSHLKKTFGIETLRDLQKRAVNATMSSKDCIVLLPTGGGKSLIFHLAALLSKGITLCVCPLVSLMEDQVRLLKELNVNADLLTAHTEKSDLNRILESLIAHNESLKILYITPEKLAKSKRFMSKLEKCYMLGNLSRIVIDEVHCCSQWGHDFRPDYKYLGILKRQFPKVPILGLTATASISVLDDVKSILSMEQSLLFRGTMNRFNLNYRVVLKPSKSEIDNYWAIANMINSHYKNLSGIVYCYSQKESESLCQVLLKSGIKTAVYHANISPELKSRVHIDWAAGDIDVICATIAFGMGINKLNVRYVIHSTPSKSIENYYQESGRAGRDGKSSDCVIMYHPTDLFKQSKIVFTEKTGLPKLYTMFKYCMQVNVCRRKLLANFMQEPESEFLCNDMCDVCKNSSEDEVSEMSELLMDALSVLDHCDSIDVKCTLNQFLDVWSGKGPNKQTAVKLPCFSLSVMEFIIVYFIINEYLSESFAFNPYSVNSYIARGIKSHSLAFQSDFKLPISIPNKMGIPKRRSEISSKNIKKCCKELIAID